MKKILTSVFLSVSALLALAQQDPQFTQSMFMKLPVNPGYAGTRGNLCATTAYRTQWVGFAGAPKTFFLTADMPVKDLDGGIGLTVLKDKLGNFNFTHARGAYSYHRTVNHGIGLLGAGFELGMLQSSVENNWVAPDGSNGTVDPYIPNTFVKQTTYDFGVGIYYKTNDMFAGFSMSHFPGRMEHLTAPKFNYDAARHYYLMAGYYYRPTPLLTLRPSLFVKTDNAVLTADLHCDLLYNDFVWAGFSYRPKDALAPSLGIAFKPMGVHSASLLKIGYSYDIGLSDLQAHHNNTHEIVVNYCIRWIKPDPSHKNPRMMGDDHPFIDEGISPVHWQE